MTEKELMKVELKDIIEEYGSHIVSPDPSEKVVAFDWFFDPEREIVVYELIVSSKEDGDEED